MFFKSVSPQSLRELFFQDRATAIEVSVVRADVSSAGGGTVQPGDQPDQHASSVADEVTSKDKAEI